MVVESVVVIVRMLSGDQILGIMLGDVDGKVKLEHPHFVKYNPANQTMAMVPFCPLSDEAIYEVPKKDVQFVVTANKEVTQRFFEAVDILEARVHQHSLELEDDYAPLERLVFRNYVEGNTTKH